MSTTSTETTTAKVQPVQRETARNDAATGYTQNGHCPYTPKWRRKVVDLFDEHVSAETVAGEVADGWLAEGRTERLEAGRTEGIEIGCAEGELAAHRQNLLLPATTQIWTVAGADCCADSGHHGCCSI